MQILEEFHPVFPFLRRSDHGIDRSFPGEFRECRHDWIEMIPSPLPGRPAPAVGVFREVIAAIAALPAELEIRSVDMHDPLIAGESLQDFGAESEEGRVGEAVVFEDDPSVRMLEHPIDGGNDMRIAAEIPAGIVPEDLAFPIDQLGRLACPAAQLLFAWSAGSCAVRRYEKHRRLGCADFSEHLFRRAGAVEYYKEDWRTRAILRWTFHGRILACKISLR